MISIQFLNRISKVNYGQIRQMQNTFSGTKEQQLKARRRYALFGGVVMMYFGSHAVLLWRRRSEYRAMNKEVPPISFAEFERDYLLTGKIKSIVFHPNFAVCDGYVEEKDVTNEKVSKSMFQNKTFFGQKFFYKPQVRFVFKGKPEALEQSILDAQKTIDHPSEIHLEINSFPSYRELAFITISVLFGAACVGLVKL